ncbi:biotin/lipoyl-containing protein [Brevibacillus sp. B_LB10_24]|uniref:biotin/lipoyl-containing protein n=1 Tax=Brevibacillus sp. B_LB10_24 TaxID=3380645 RepID=UPI0038BC20A1
MATEVFMPKLSMTMETGTVLQWFKQEGDDVREGDLLLEVMTDKINIEVESYASGKLLKIYYGADEVVPVNQVIGYIGAEGEQVPDTPPAVEGSNGGEDGANGAAAEAACEALTCETEEDADESAGEKVRATPAARRIARENGISLLKVTGTGERGRIHQADVERYLAANLRDRRRCR